MARPTLNDSPKFKVLIRKLELPRPYVRGLLETMWDVANASGNPVLGDSEAVEAAAEWPGAPGVLFEQLRVRKWIDPIGDGEWTIHDYWDHAPEYVKGRLRKENERKRKRNGGDVSRDSHATVSNKSDTPSPSPSPSPCIPKVSTPSVPAEAAGSDGPPKPKQPRKAPSGAYHEFIRYFCDRWKAKYGGDFDFGSRGKANGKAVKKILANPNVKGDLALANSVTDRYLACGDDSVISKQRHSLTMLLNQINRFSIPAKRAEFVEDGK